MLYVILNNDKRQQKRTPFKDAIFQQVVKHASPILVLCSRWELAQGLPCLTEWEALFLTLNPLHVFLAERRWVVKRFLCVQYNLEKISASILQVITTHCWKRHTVSSFCIEDQKLIHNSILSLGWQPWFCGILLHPPTPPPCCLSNPQNSYNPHHLEEC